MFHRHVGVGGAFPVRREGIAQLVEAEFVFVFVACVIVFHMQHEAVAFQAAVDNGVYGPVGLYVFISVDSELHILVLAVDKE